MSRPITHRLGAGGRSRARAWGRWRSGRRILPAVMLVAGCAGFPPSAREQLLTAYGQYRDREYEQAASTLTVLLHDYPRQRESAEAYYLRGLCSAKQSQTVSARSDVLSCIRYSKQTDLTTKAHAMVGELLFEAGRAAEAIPHYAAVVPRIDVLPQRDRSLLRYHHALCLQRVGRWRDSRLESAAVFQRYPGSDCAEHARRIYDWPHDHFSIQCGVFRDGAGATRLEAKLRQARLRARVESRRRSGELLHTVFVGRYPLHEQARDALGSVQRHVSDALIVP